MSLSPTIADYLSRHGAAYALESHMHSFCSLESAREAGVDEESLAKSVVLQDEAGFVLAVLPASRRLELDRVREELGRALHVSREQDMVRLFPDCEWGAVPPIGAAYGLPTVLDASLEERDEIYFEGGDHETLVRMSGAAFLDLLEDATVAEIASESTTLLSALATRARLRGRLDAVSRAIGAPVGSGRRWTLRLRREIAALARAVEAHIEETERPDGVLREIVEVAPRCARDVDRLVSEREALRAECDRLAVLIDSGAGPLSLRRRVHLLLQRFEL
ncbi:YbaK/EbsC family protein, partial [Myxococcota bacterium]|nr:YbaK/EbsC family protein [Myxococcota bacterium]